MGAGRSGTTALATFLGNNNEIQNIGEMHQFFEYLEERKECSCGDQLQKCEFWDNKISNNLIQSSTKNRILSEKFESHSSIVKHILQLFSKKEIEEYIEIHQQLLNTIQLDSEKTTLLDSSKYIGRALALDKLENIDLKVIYVVRDLRGVINSFSKNVQTSKSPLSTIVYYLVVNSVSEFVAKILLRKKVVKIRYEDLVNNPLQVFSRLETFLKMDLTDVKNKIIDKQPFSLGHIVGGNRLKKNKEIYFRKDVSWEDKFSLVARVSYYILAFPIMFLNCFML